MPPARFSSSRHAFTLIELLVVITIIAIIAAISFPVYNAVILKSRQTATLSNMRQVALAFSAYAGDNGNQLPVRATINADGSSTEWPALLVPYVQNVLVYSSPIPNYLNTSYRVTDPVKLTNSKTNYTSCIANGCNDTGVYSDPAASLPRLNLISQPTQVILLGIPFPARGNFRVDVINKNEAALLNKSAWSTGSIYAFCDGSSRFLKYRSSDNMSVQPTTSDYYTDWLWLIDKSNPTK